MKPRVSMFSPTRKEGSTLFQFAEQMRDSVVQSNKPAKLREPIFFPETRNDLG